MICGIVRDVVVLGIVRISKFLKRYLVKLHEG